MYANKVSLAKLFGITTATVYRRIEGIKKEIGTRYNRYAILDNLTSIAVFADYEKYHKQLADKNLRKYVPDFDMNEASAYMFGESIEQRRKTAWMQERAKL